MQRAELEEKQSEQQTLLYEQRAQQAKLTQALSERKKTLAGLESSIQQGQQQLSELRANESVCVTALPVRKPRRKRVLNVKRAKPRRFATARKKRRAKAPPTSRPKAKNR